MSESKPADQSDGSNSSPQTRLQSLWKPVLIAFLAIIAFFFLKDARLGKGLGSFQITKEQPNRQTTLPIPPPEEAREAILNAFKTSWHQYEQHAWGSDEYHPVSQTGSNLTSTGQSIGYMIVDVLDCLLVMGMDEEYARARKWVQESLTFDVDARFHAFEVTIRVLGGLLSAYHISKDEMYLEKAVDLGDRILPIFNTPSGIPTSFINLATGEAIYDFDNRNFSSLAEAGTLQLEFKYLAELTQDKKYWEKVSKVIDVIDANQKQDGILPIFVDPLTGEFRVSDIRLGSRGDSYYEYLLKQYLQTSKKEPKLRKMYDEAVGGIKKHLVKQSSRRHVTHTMELQPRYSQTSGLTFVRTNKQDHLVCFLPGLLLLGVTEGVRFESDPSSLSYDKAEDWAIGYELSKGCVETYTESRTGLGAEIVVYYESPEDAVERDWFIDKRIPGAPPPIDARNILRPETAESLFTAYRITGDPIFRKWGWNIFMAFEKHCKLADGKGYAGIRDVDELPVVHEDKMETFWLSETLKYLYLLFSEPDVLPLDKYVFNTEAHPLPIFDPTVVDVKETETEQDDLWF